jgi:5-dehydro-2-deoxygluconokinase
MLGPYAGFGFTLGVVARGELGGDEQRRARAAPYRRLGHDSRGMTDLDLLTVGRVGVDLYPEQSHVPLARVRTFAKSIGGTATNVAVAAARLGLRAAVLTKVGDDPFGAYVREALASEFGVDTRYVSTHPALPTPIVFCELDPPEDPRLLFYRHPKAPDLELVPDDVDLAAVREVPIFWVAGSCFAEEPSRSTVRTLLGERARRPHTVLDLDWRPMFWRSPADGAREIGGAIDHVTVAIGNRAECEVAVGTADPELAADRLLARGVELAIVKLGGDGVYVATAAGARTVVPPIRVDVVCGLGAGDAFGGALCHGLLAGLEPAEAVRLANAAGAIVAGRLLCAAAMPTLAEVEALAANAARGEP